MGALEYDPELVIQQHHRDFLRDKVVFKEVVPISDPALRAKIHQTYRLAYLKDVVLPRVLDDATFATFSSLILFNNVEVCQSFYPDLLQCARAASPLLEGFSSVCRDRGTCGGCSQNTSRGTDMCLGCTPDRYLGISGNARTCAGTSSPHEAALMSYVMWWAACRWSWHCKETPSSCRSCSRG